MSVAVISGSAGLVGSEAVAYFSNLGMDVVGIDNGMRAEFFGPKASTKWVRDRLARNSAQSTFRKIAAGITSGGSVIWLIFRIIIRDGNCDTACRTSCKKSTS